MCVHLVYVRGVDASGIFFFFQAEDGIRDLVRSRGLGDVYKRQDECDGQSGDVDGQSDRRHRAAAPRRHGRRTALDLSLIHI